MAVQGWPRGNTASIQAVAENAVLARRLDHRLATLFTKEADVKPMEAAVIGALISGVAMYAVGARAQNGIVGNGLVEETPVALTQPRAVAAPATSRFVAVSQPAVSRTPVRVVETVAAEPRVVETRRERPWQKTALIIGGAAASGAGVGGMIDGKKGALIGAAVGGGAASIYEATRR